MGKIKTLFSKEIQDLLTEESLDAIQVAFDDKVKIALEAALEEQDSIYAERLEKLITAIDKDHTSKMKRIVEAVDTKNASKLVKLVKLFRRDSLKDANKYKKQIVESLNLYLEEYLSEVINPDELAQAVKNKSAYNVLENLRGVLSVNSAVVQESVREAVLDGQDKINKLLKENEELKNKNKVLNEKSDKVETRVFLEEKLVKFNDNKKVFIRKALQDKSKKFIEENFDYTSKLFDRKEKEKLQVLKEEALNKREVKPDVVPVQKINEQKVSNTEDELVEECVSILENTWTAKK